jgi:HSP20 family protein
MNHTTELCCRPSAALTPSTTVRPQSTIQPAYETHQDDHAYSLRLELPGVEKTDIKLVFQGDVLELNAARAVETPSTWTTLRRETSAGAYRLRLRFPEGVDGTAITARYELGVLNISLPKVSAVQRRSIEVN